MANVFCHVERSACAIRATRLDASCLPVEGEGNAAISTAIATITATPDVTEGARFNPTNACGAVIFTAADPNVTTRYTLEMELITTDFELIELLTSSSLILGAADAGPSNSWAGDTIGLARPGPTTGSSAGAALEVWVKAGSGVGACGPASTNPPYVRHVFPRVLLEQGTRTFENDVANVTFTGFAESNNAWGLGPWGDYPGEDPAADTGSPWYSHYDTALPDASCGYIDVPPYGS